VAQIRLNPTVVNNVTTYATMISVPNNDLRLKPGMTTNLKIQVSRRSDALRVPNAAIRFRPSIDTFAALNQPVPPEAQGGGRGRRGGPGGQGGNRGDNASASSSGGASQGSRQAPPSGSPSASAQPGTQADAGGASRGGFGGGNGRGGGGFSNDPQRQARLMERFKSMSPDEQQQLIARMKDRGADTSAFEQLMSAGKKGAKASTKKGATAEKGFVFQPRYGEAQSSEEIQELFRPLPTTQTQGRVWLFVDRQLKPVNLRLGITDGTFTELVNGDLQEGTELVTGVTGVTSARTAAAGAGNPLLGQQNQRGGFGGPGGFGGGGGRGR
jgi:HlyD family secretion protein